MDAVYPNATVEASVERLQSYHTYIIHFEEEELPPVNAFWSLTMYIEKNFLASNPINRFALGDRDPLQYNEDGTLDPYVQRENPDPERESNWLPTPALLGSTCSMLLAERRLP